MRALKWGIFVIAAILLGWRSVTVNLAEHYASRDEPEGAEDALRWRSGEPLALLRRGLQLLSTDPQAAEIFLRRAVEANPANGYAYSQLALLQQNQGRLAEAADLAAIADRLAPMRSPVQLSVAELWAHQNQVQQAVEHLSRALELNPGLRQGAYPTLLQLAEDPQAEPAFAALLEKRNEPPSWWPGFFAYASRNAERPETVGALYYLGSRSGQAGAEQRYYIARLQKAGLWQEAYFLWLNGLSREQLAELGYVYNGGFELPLSDEGFDWRIVPTRGVAVEVIPVYGATGKLALHVAFQGQRVRPWLLYQHLLLGPGDYQLQGRVWTDNLQSAQGVQWVLRCMADSGEILLTSERFLGNSLWRRFATPFQVPDDDCPAQELRLELAGRFGHELEAGGAVWFDELRVVRLNSSPQSSQSAEYAGTQQPSE